MEDKETYKYENVGNFDRYSMMAFAGIFIWAMIIVVSHPEYTQFVMFFRMPLEVFCVWTLSGGIIAVATLFFYQMMPKNFSFPSFWLFLRNAKGLPLIGLFKQSFDDAKILAIVFSFIMGLGLSVFLSFACLHQFPFVPLAIEIFFRAFLSAYLSALILPLYFLKMEYFVKIRKRLG